MNDCFETGYRFKNIKKMNKKDAIYHKYPIYAKNEMRNCTRCEHARQIAPHEWECDAVVYDIKGLTCFVERKEQTWAHGATAAQLAHNQ